MDSLSDFILRATKLARSRLEGLYVMSNMQETEKKKKKKEFLRHTPEPSNFKLHSDPVPCRQGPLSQLFTQQLQDILIIGNETVTI